MALVILLPQASSGDDGDIGVSQMDAMADSTFVDPMRRAGWECGDGFLSHELPDGRTLWLYHDSVVSGRMLRNVGGISSLDSQGNVEYSMLVGSDARGFIRRHGDPRERWYWPGVPLPQVQDRYVHIPAARMRRVEEASPPFNFAIEGSRVITYRYRAGALRRVGTSRPPYIVGWDGRPLSWGMATAFSEGYVYIYATGASPDPQTWGSAVFVARVREGRLNRRRVTGFQLLTKQGWRRESGVEVGDLVQLGESFSTVFVVKPRRNKVLAVAKTYEMLGATIDLYRAANPEEPFTRVRALVRLPLVADAMTYWAKVHPTLPAPEGKVWGSSNNNPTEPMPGCPADAASGRPLWYLLPGRLR